MEYLKLIFGIVFIIVFVWLLRRNLNRTTVMDRFFQFDTILGLAAGLYLVITSLVALLT